MFNLSIVHRWKVIAFAYSWRDRPHSGGRNLPVFPEYWPLHGEKDARGVYQSFPQNTQAYGRKCIEWCNRAGIDILVGYRGAGDKAFSLEIFKKSFEGIPLADFGPLRLAHIVQEYRAEALERTLRAQLHDMKSQRYARIRDLRGNLRPLICIWGPDAGGWPGDFKTLIGNFRAEAMREEGVGNPFILLTDHTIHKHHPDITKSVDGFYRAVPKLEGRVTGHPEGTHRSTREAIPGTVSLWTQLKDAVDREGVREEGLPVQFIPGTGPQFARGKKPGTPNATEGEIKEFHDRGWIEAGLRDDGRPPDGKQQVEEMFAAMRPFAPVLSVTKDPTAGAGLRIILDRWVTVSTLNEWPEATCLEPCRTGLPGDQGGVGPDGRYRYGYDFLDAIAEVFGPRAVTKLEVGSAWSRLVYRWKKVGESPRNDGVPDDFHLRFFANGTFSTFFVDPYRSSHGGNVVELDASGRFLTLFTEQTGKVETWKVALADQGRRLTLTKGGFSQIFQRMPRPSEADLAPLAHAWEKFSEQPPHPHVPDRFIVRIERDGSLVTHRPDGAHLERGEIEHIDTSRGLLRIDIYEASRRGVHPYQLRDRGRELWITIEVGGQQILQKFRRR